MGAVGFICPDGEEITFKRCLKECRMSERCMSVATLKMMSDQRPNDRPPSTTELLSGTCEAYLKRTEEYYVDPQDMAFAVMGTIHHLHLESQELDDNAIQEEKLEGLDITGILDFYDKDTETLIDYKNTGSFKASKVLGMTHVMMPDPSGARYKKSGAWGKKGAFKQVKVFHRDENKADFGDWLYQVNMYRYLLEKKGHKVKAMKLQMNVRDAGTHSAIARGVDKNIYFVNIPMVDNKEIVSYFTNKRDVLLEHLNTNTIPRRCNDEETWNGKKCEKYCEVRGLCPYVNGLGE